MKDNSRLKSEDFERLLQWLDADRDEAGKKYEEIRNGLIRFFRFKGLTDAENLADETITRVAEKVSDFDTSKNVKTITYFYGFASNIFLEELRNRKRQAEKTAEFVEYQSRLADFDNEAAEKENACLRECLTKISADDRTIFIEYYAFKNGKKAETRRQIADRLQIEMNNLHVKVFRMRDVLRKCVKKCLEK